MITKKPLFLAFHLKCVSVIKIIGCSRFTVAELPHLQVKSSGVRQVKKISRVHWGAMPVNELSQAQEYTLCSSH